MTEVFNNKFPPFIKIYMDDLIIHSEGFEQHIEHLNVLFAILNKHNLKLNIDKCHFAKNTIKYLGHIISNEGIMPDPDKISVVENFPIPSTKREVRSFLGLCQYYSKFMPKLAHLAAPLNALTSTKITFRWSDHAGESFERLKQLLIEAPILAHPDFSSAFTLHTDASNHAVGIALCQVQDGDERAIAYYGKALNSAEKNYSTTEKEMLAIIVGLKKFKPYLFGSKFLVHSDHKPLKYMLDQTDPKGRVARWLLYAQPYQFKIIYKKGSENTDADALSRRPYPPALNVVATPETPDPSIAQKRDPLIGPIFQHLKNKILPIDDTEAKQVISLANQCILGENDRIYFIPLGLQNKKRRNTLLFWVPGSLVANILQQCHDDLGHFGMERTFGTIA